MAKKRSIALVAVLSVTAIMVWLIAQRLLDGNTQRQGGADGGKSVPVEVVAIEQGPIELRRTFTGTLDAGAEFVVAPKIGGRVEDVNVDLGDSVDRGQVVARMDHAEYVLAVTQAEADLTVAQANLAEAKSQLTIAERELKRLDKLRERGVSSASQLDLAKAEQLAKQAHLEVTRAQVIRAEAALETARVRLGYTEVKADWTGGGERRLVAERYLDEGETVAANAPLLRIVELDPLIAVFFVTERDYALLQTGQRAELGTDSYPGERFPGEIVRIAPVFRANTRQARVEVRVDNPKLRLKPGMFARISLVLERVAETLIVPEQALVTRDGQNGLFLVVDNGRSVTWREVTVGIQQGDRVQVSAENLDGPVVILGQQLLKDGSPVSIAGPAEAATP